MKKKLFLLFLILLPVFSCNLIKYKQVIKKIKIENIDLSKVKDGEYEGFCDAYLINAKVVVQVKDNKINKIELLEHKHGKGYGIGIEKMIDNVIYKQSLQVDTITGATLSCKVILEAIEIALKKGI